MNYNEYINPALTVPVWCLTVQEKSMHHQRPFIFRFFLFFLDTGTVIVCEQSIHCS